MPTNLQTNTGLEIAVNGRYHYQQFYKIVIIFILVILNIIMACLDLDIWIKHKMNAFYRKYAFRYMPF